MNRPEDLHLSREDGEALIERLETETWTAEDRQVLIQVVRLYFLAPVCPQGNQTQSEPIPPHAIWGKRQVTQAAIRDIIGR